MRLFSAVSQVGLLGSFIFAAILTPTPDPFNQCLMALPSIYSTNRHFERKVFQQKEAGAGGVS